MTSEHATAFDGTQDAAADLRGPAQARLDGIHEPVGPAR